MKLPGSGLALWVGVGNARHRPPVRPNLAVLGLWGRPNTGCGTCLIRIGYYTGFHDIICYHQPDEIDASRRGTPSRDVQARQPGNYRRGSHHENDKHDWLVHGDSTRHGSTGPGTLEPVKDCGRLVSACRPMVVVMDARTQYAWMCRAG